MVTPGERVRFMLTALTSTSLVPLCEQLTTAVPAARTAAARNVALLMVRIIVQSSSMGNYSLTLVVDRGRLGRRSRSHPLSMSEPKRRQSGYGRFVLLLRTVTS